MAGYRDLKVWQAGIKLTVQVYRVTADFPDNERYGLVSQMRRAAVSIPSNIAEGHARNSSKEMVRFCGIALGSLAELETQLLIAKELNFTDEVTYEELETVTSPLGRMLHGLIRSNRASTQDN